MSSDPVSWFVIEAGWKVFDASGEQIGSVDEVVGDSSDDIFNGLSISTGLLGRPRYVPSEQVASITEGRVTLRISRAQAERLEEYEEPPTSAEILPEEAGTARRTETAVAAPIHSHEERLNVLTRLRHALRRLLGR